MWKPRHRNSHGQGTGTSNKQPFYVHYELAGAGQIDWSVKRERQRRTGQSPFPLRFGYHSQDTRRRTCGSQDQASQDSTRRLLVYSVGGSKNVVCGRWGPRFSWEKAGRRKSSLPGRLNYRGTRLAMTSLFVCLGIHHGCNFAGRSRSRPVWAGPEKREESARLNSNQV